LKSSLEETEGQLGAANKEISRLKEIVAQVSGAEPALEVAEAMIEPEIEPEPELEPELEAVLSADEPELAPIDETAAPEPEPEPVVTAIESPLSEEGHISLGELVLEDEDLSGLDLEPKVAAEPAAAAAEPAAAADPAAAEPESAAAVSDELAFLESLSLGGNKETESFSFLEDRGSGTPGTIICPHCSAANDPAEWYCTECGEELPAE
jgi:hypothetical protein